MIEILQVSIFISEGNKVVIVIESERIFIFKSDDFTLGTPQDTVHPEIFPQRYFSLKDLSYKKLQKLITITSSL